MKRILVTGGAGFIGNNLCRKLLKENNHVICVDNLYSSEYPWALTKLNSFEFIRHDITFPLYLEVDEIYHMACPASPIHYQRDPVQTTKTNVLGTINMLGLAKRTKAKILLTSTSEIYGDPTEHPQKESYWGNVNPIGPRSCYDEGKRCAETLFFDYQRQHGVDIRVARIFNTYGPYMRPDDGRVVSNFINQALKGDPITIYGSGEQTRSFCYVSDLVEGLIRLMASDCMLPVNLGNPNEFTIKELAIKVLQNIQRGSEIIYNPLPVDDPRQRQPDITRAKTCLNWVPITQLEEGLHKTIDYFTLKNKGAFKIYDPGAGVI